MTRTMYVAIRRDDTHEYMSVESFAGSVEMAQHAADKLDRKLGYWASANPVARIAKLTVTEVE